MKELLRKLSNEQIKINWNKSPIPMAKFLGFLTINTERNTGDFLGKCTGWTQWFGDGLLITGGVVGGTEYLDRIEYKKHLDNPYNNYVHPFYMFDVMTQEGRDFFVKYYEQDIEKILCEFTAKRQSLEIQLERAHPARNVRV